MEVKVNIPTEEEFYNMLVNSNITEFEELYKISDNPYEYLLSICKRFEGLFVNDRLIYVFGIDKNNQLWTIVRNDVKKQFTLYKSAKRLLNEWYDEYGKITATMSSNLVKNLKWTKRLGFKECRVIDGYVTLEFNKGGM